MEAELSKYKRNQRKLAIRVGQQKRSFEVKHGDLMLNRNSVQRISKSSIIQSKMFSSKWLRGKEHKFESANFSRADRTDSV